MNVDEKDVTTATTIIAFLVTWILWLLGIGKMYGHFSATVDRHDEEIKGLQDEFKTKDGEPRLVSYAAHDKIQASCQALLMERHHSLTSRLDQQDKKLDQILTAVGGGKNDNRT